MKLDKYIELSRKLIELERSAELEQNRILLEQCSLKQLCDAGVAVNKLRSYGVRTGMFGRTLIKLGLLNDRVLPSHKLSSGDIVAVCFSGQSQSDHLCEGLVSKVTDKAITVAIDHVESFGHVDGVDADGRLLCVVKQANDITYQRLNRCIGDLEHFENYPGSYLVKLLFGQCPLPPLIDQTNTEFIHHNDNLNVPQREAVAFALDPQRPVSLIHGPPGTGKTTTVCELVGQAVNALHYKVLVCAPSNVAVDNLVERLANNPLFTPGRLVRLGHPARLFENCRAYALDAVLAKSDNSSICDDLKREITENQKRLHRRDVHAAEARSLRNELKQLRQDLSRRESKALRDCLNGASVVAATLTSVTRDGPLKALWSNKGEKKVDLKAGVLKEIFSGFDLLVIDECAQSMEIACWLALLLAKKCVLVGDHCQLPPTIISEKAASDGLSVTLMERVLKELGSTEKEKNNLIHLLNVQYRMNQLIMKWPSDQLYGGQLIAAKSVQNHLLCDIPNVTEGEETKSALWFIDTDDCDMFELDTPAEMSKGNLDEVRLTYCHVSALVDCGVESSKIAIISPYNLQVSLLRSCIHPHFPKVEIRSVDGYQGQEREAVIISLVRSNRKGQVGFLSEDRRLNVAITRAKRHISIIGDSSTISSHGFMKSMVSYFAKNAVYKSALEYNEQLCKVDFNPDLSEYKDSLGRSIDVDSDVGKPKPPKKNDKVKKVVKIASEKERSEKLANLLNPLVQQAGHFAVSSLVIETVEETRESLLEKSITSFVADCDKKEYWFTSELNAFERRLVHEIAERFELLHNSEGDGDKRRIVLRKSDILHESIAIEKVDQSEAAGASNADDHAVFDVSSMSDVTNETLCECCAKLIPNNNLDLHRMRCFKKVKAAVNVESTTAKGSNKSGGKKKPKKVRESVDEDIDEVLERFAKDAKQCTQSECKESIVLFGQKCEYCEKVFCLKHMFADTHGCERVERIKKRQAQQIINGVITAKSNNKLKDVKREQLQKKFDQKLTDMKSTRQTKGPKN